MAEEEEEDRGIPEYTKVFERDLSLEIGTRKLLRQETVDSAFSEVETPRVDRRAMPILTRQVLARGHRAKMIGLSQGTADSETAEPGVHRAKHCKLFLPE